MQVNSGIALKTPGDVGLELKADIAQGSKSILLSILVLRLRTTPVYGITQIVEYKDRKGPHALPLFGTKRFVEWLPRLGEFIQVCRSLGQGFRASLQKGDRVTIFQDIKAAGTPVPSRRVPATTSSN
jgi:hypothetical protein